MLSNLETIREKLIQIILLGQPELLRLLSLPSLRQLNERITVRYHLKPLLREDVRHYIEHRLSAAEGNPDVAFTPGAYGAICASSRGIPRRINAICDRALLVAYGRDLRTIDRRLVKEAIRDIGPGYLWETGNGRREAVTVRILLALLVAAFLLLGGYLVRGELLKLLD